MKKQLINKEIEEEIMGVFLAIDDYVEEHPDVSDNPIINLDYNFEDGSNLKIGINRENNTYFIGCSGKDVKYKKRKLSENIRITNIEFSEGLSEELIVIEFDLEFGVWFIAYLMTMILTSLMESDKSHPREDLFILIEDVVKYFLKKSKNKNYSEKKKVGIYTEIFVLNNLMDLGLNQSKRVSPESILYSWNGPYLDEHDFWNGEVALEVKGISGKYNDVVIHGPEQLTIPSDKELYLRVIRLEKKNPELGSPSLTELIESINKKLDSNSHKEFSMKLIRLDIDYSQIDFYSDWCYKIIFDRIYPVSSGFPKIDLEIIGIISQNDVISDLKYKIRLDKLQTNYFGERDHDAVLDKYVYSCNENEENNFNDLN